MAKEFHGNMFVSKSEKIVHVFQLVSIQSLIQSSYFISRNNSFTKSGSHTAAQLFAKKKKHSSSSCRAISRFSSLLKAIPRFTHPTGPTTAVRICSGPNNSTSGVLAPPQMAAEVAGQPASHSFVSASTFRSRTSNSARDWPPFVSFQTPKKKGKSHRFGRILVRIPKKTTVMICLFPFLIRIVFNRQFRLGLLDEVLVHCFSLYLFLLLWLLFGNVPRSMGCGRGTPKTKRKRSQRRLQIQDVGFVLVWADSNDVWIRMLAVFFRCIRCLLLFSSFFEGGCSRGSGTSTEHRKQTNTIDPYPERVLYHNTTHHTLRSPFVQTWTTQQSIRCNTKHWNNQNKTCALCFVCCSGPCSTGFLLGLPWNSVVSPA